MPGRIATDELLADLRRVSGESPPTQREYRSEGKYDPDTYQRRFGSWSAALEKAGYDVNKSGRRGKLTRDDVLTRLRTAAAKLGHAPSTYDAQNEDVAISKDPVYRHFDTWGDALAAAGLADDRPTHCDECGCEFDTQRAWSIHQTRVHGEDAPDVGLLEAIQNLADGEESPTQRDMATDGAYSSDLYQQVFGSWPVALQEAGFEPPQKAYQNVSTKELLDELRRLADELGRSPRLSDIAEYGRYSRRPYTSRFGSWIEAQKAANLEPTRNPPGEGEGARVGKWEKRRLVALRRDQTRCQDCGLTDAESHAMYGKSLEVHHITFYDKFDDPEAAHDLDNLLTLCRQCHAKRHSD